MSTHRQRIDVYAAALSFLAVLVASAVIYFMGAS